ncbi:MAG: hypothetical protein KDD44_07900, partial [Bdellovibrionales bacterium]|nr:hypothetical protein [Bdellovibrionales bacterium]
MSDVLLICADASPRIGGGHVLRSLAIAEAWLEGDPRRQALLFGAIESPRLIRRAEQSEVLVKAVPASLTVTEELQQIEHWLAELQIRDAPFVVVDGYRFDEGYLREVRERAKALAVVEDYVRLPHYDCDILLNANLYAPELKYSTAPRTKVLLGTEYSLLRTEFRRWKHWPREIPETAHKLLLSCGAADGENLTAVLLKHLEAEPL